ncbi:hypothetical protein NA57DRAFT_70739 [Rhizodiscina lignyota]|uniref:Velvet domain-containing protein n=1 Tax=Rhizodiscina lignyota TaxID=1504668 RepID=A0A9P4INU1_9PEZI|nr:hypothetical protein NA57DRAFT_70739 [Rhizodiscina lignyota]
MMDVGRHTSIRRLGAQEVRQGATTFRDKSSYETRVDQRAMPDGRRTRRKRLQKEQAGSVHDVVPDDTEPSFQLRSYTTIPSRLAVGEAFDAMLHVSAAVAYEADMMQDTLAAGQLFGAASLLTVDALDYVEETPRGILSGLQLFDTVHELDDSDTPHATGPTSLSPLGYISFPGMSIAAPGVYMLRVTLHCMNSALTSTSEAGPQTVQVLLSDIIVVEGR